MYLCKKYKNKLRMFLDMENERKKKKVGENCMRRLPDYIEYNPTNRNGLEFKPRDF